MEQAMRYFQHWYRLNEKTQTFIIQQGLISTSTDTQIINVDTTQLKVSKCKIYMFLNAILMCVYSYTTIGTEKETPPALALNDIIKCKHISMSKLSFSQILWIITREKEEVP